MKNTILVAQIVVAILLVGTILVQARGTGLARVWGGAQGSFTRRGLERLIFRATFALAAIFIILSILALII